MAQSIEKVYTIGYQGKSVDEFIQDLTSSGVEVLIDIRRKAISRKSGFSKSRLREELESAGIEYRHHPELGMPIDLMPKRNLKDNSAILRVYQEGLSEQSRSIRHLIDLASIQPVCLLCFEADHELCHRGVLASRLMEEAGFSIDHL